MSIARNLSAAAIAGVASIAVITAPALATGSHKVTICHLPPGNPGNAHTITVAYSALPAHFKHGDRLGACNPAPTPTPTPTPSPSPEPSTVPTTEPTTQPTSEPTTEPTSEPTVEPSSEPTTEPTPEPTVDPTTEPTEEPTSEPTAAPTTTPTVEPTSPLEPTIPITDTPLTPDTEIGTPAQLERRTVAREVEQEQASTQHLANTGGTERGYAVGTIALVASGLVLVAGNRWARRDEDGNL